MYGNYQKNYQNLPVALPVYAKKKPSNCSAIVVYLQRMQLECTKV